jgi:hypothetical protein
VILSCIVLFPFSLASTKQLVMYLRRKRMIQLLSYSACQHENKNDVHHVFAGVKQAIAARENTPPARENVSTAPSPWSIAPGPSQKVSADLASGTSPGSTGTRGDRRDRIKARAIGAFVGCVIVLTIALAVLAMAFLWRRKQVRAKAAAGNQVPHSSRYKPYVIFVIVTDQSLRRT